MYVLTQGELSALKSALTRAWKRGPTEVIATKNVKHKCPACGEVWEHAIPPDDPPCECDSRETFCEVCEKSMD